jgi:hypothetical protein
LAEVVAAPQEQILTAFLLFLEVSLHLAAVMAAYEGLDKARTAALAVAVVLILMIMPFRVPALQGRATLAQQETTLQIIRVAAEAVLALRQQMLMVQPVFHLLLLALL